MIMTDYTFNPSDVYRVSVERDMSAECPISRPGKDIECYLLPGSNASIDYYARNADDIIEIAGIVSDMGGGTDELVGALDKHYDRRGWSHCVYTLAGRCQSDYVRLYVAMRTEGYCDAETFCRNNLQSWWDGDVYVMTLERRREWRDSDGNVMYTWDDLDALCGVYSRDIDAEWRDLAGEYFAIPPDILSNVTR